MNHNPTPMKVKFFPLFNVNLSQLNLNSSSTKLRLNLISTSFQPQVQINLSLNINQLNPNLQLFLPRLTIFFSNFIWVLFILPNFEFESWKSPEGFWLNSSPYPYTIGLTRLGCFYVTAILSWGYGWGWLEAEVDLNMRLKWGWDEI